MKKCMTFICLLALLFQVLPGLAMADDAGLDDQAENEAIRVEAENYTSISPADIQHSSDVRAIVLNGSTEISNNDILFMYKSSATDGGIAAGGYTVSYSVMAPAAGAYSLEIVASLINREWLSPYQIKVNDGSYFDVTEANTNEVEQISVPNGILAKYELASPVLLAQGDNTISFRVQEGRQLDGDLHFYMDYLEVTPLPLGAVRVEAESYTSISPADIQHSSDVRAIVLNGSTEISNNDILFMYKSSATDGGIAAGGYTVSYSVTAPITGAYSLEIVASQLNKPWLSPYQIKVNDGSYFDVAEANTNEVEQISVPNGILAKYKLAAPVSLMQGENTIFFHVKQGRQLDGDLHFYMDYLEVAPLPWGLNGISIDAPLAVFEEGDSKHAAIRFIDGASQGHLLSYKVEDYEGNIVLQEMDIALENDQLAYDVDLSLLGRGHYTLTAEVDHNGQPISEYVSVVMNSSDRSLSSSSPFALDVAGSMLFPASSAGDYARAARLAGVNYIRDRMHWSWVASAKDVYDFSYYEDYRQAYENNGLRVLQMNHTTPAWARGTGKDLPANLLDAYNLAKTSVQHFGLQADWEFWNEPDINYTADSESADQYAAFLKATTIAARDSGVPTSVALAGLAYPPGNYTELLMQNDAAEYIDVYNYHAHRNDNDDELVPDVPSSFAAQSQFIQDYDLGEKSIYVTEAGISQKFEDSTNTLTAEQLRMQARYLTASTVQSLASGVDKHFWFVFPYYLENGLSWGSFSSRGTPYASLSAQAAMTNALGEAVYLGQLSGLPSGVNNYVFRDGIDSVVAYWSEEETAFALAAGNGTALLTDIMGREQQLISVDASYALTSTPNIHYLRIAGSFPGLTTPVYETPVAQAEALTAAERVVLTQKYPESTAAKAKAKGYLLDKTEATEIVVDVYNFNDVALSGVVYGSSYGGWVLDVPSQTVTVAPYEKATLSFLLSGSSSVAADVRAPVVFQGLFDGESTSRSVTFVASNENQAVTPSLMVPDVDDPTLWKENISTGSTSTFTSPDVGEIQFDYNFGSGDRWAYPKFKLPTGTSFAESEGLTFEVYFSDPLDDVVIRSFVYEQNGAGYFTPNNIQPTGGWQQIKMPWADFSSFGIPDDNFHLDPELIRNFSIGINSSSTTQVSFKVRNIGVYTQPNTGLYSKISALTPGDNQEVTAGTVAVSAELVQGEIPLLAQSIQVWVDGVSVARQVSGATVMAEVFMDSGIHTVKIKGFDVTGRLVSASAKVTVVADEEPNQEEEEPKNTDHSGSTNHSGSSQVPSKDGKATIPAGSSGTANLQDKVKVIVPAGASRTAIKLVISEMAAKDRPDMPQELTLVGAVYDISKDVPGNFDKQVTVRFAIDPAEADGRTLSVYYYDEAKKEWIELGGTVSDGFISVEVDHLAKFAVFRKAKSDRDEEVRFTDVAGHWAAAQIGKAVEQGIIKGYQDGTFRPEGLVTRAEFAVMIARALQLPAGGGVTAFADAGRIPIWAQDGIAKAVGAGIIRGYADQTFAPGRQISRAEMAAMIARAAGFDITAAETSFADNAAIASWARGSIAAVADAGLMNGEGKNQFAPNERATRAEAVTVILRLLAYKN